MKNIIRLSILLVFIFGVNVSFAKYQKKIFKVTIVNLTKGQPLTPAVLAVHAPSFNMVHLGQAPSEGLAALAEDGETSKLVDELKNEKEVVRTSVGEGVFLPGNTQELMVEANDLRFEISLVSMLARTNDAFLIAKNISTKLRVGQKSTTLAEVYDAGSEENTELCEHVPAPPCNSHGKKTLNNEGFVRPHEGILGVGDLDLSRDSFSSIVGKIIVERIQ